MKGDKIMVNTRLEKRENSLKEINTNTMEKAVIYVRVPSEEQAKHGFSIENQKKVCSEFAERNGYYIDKLFVDEGKSAKNLDRPEIQELMLYCSKKKNNIKAVIIWRLDRISRNTRDYHGILKPLFEQKAIEYATYFEQDLQNCKLYTETSRKKQNIFVKLIISFCRMFSALL